ncbi:MAG: ribonuclease H-like domain-containing protein [Ardenticatenaceae bacterium]
MFDLETQRDIVSAGGRGSIEKLGVSVGVAYHVGERRFYHFDEPRIGALVALLQAAELVVGYNIHFFDFRVLSAYTEIDLASLPSCDLLVSIERALGHRVTLDSLATQTLGLQKSADGTLALKWWREGRLDLIRDYCQQDVDITRRLWEYGRAHGHVWYWNKQQKQRRPVPVRW